MNNIDTDTDAAIKPDMTELPDRGELVSLMEPMQISESSRQRGALADLAVDLAAHSTGFRRSLPQGVLTALADLVRAMNCYYSNLIEGQDTHPLDIERALRNDYSTNADMRNLQLEAKAHIAVQQWVDESGLQGGALSTDSICEIHKRFGELLPAELLQPERLRNRILLWAEEEIRAGALPKKAGSILETLLYRGELPRSDVPHLLGASDRHARRVVATLTERGVVISDSTRAPLRLNFPAKLVPRWMPGLFPEK